MSKITKKEMNKVAKLKEEEQRFNTNALNHLAKISKLPRPNYSNPKDIERVCVQYFSLCVEDDIKPTVTGFAMALGVTRTTLLNWVNGSARVESRELIVKYYSMIETFDELALKEGKTNPIGSIFLMKNNYGYTDRTEIKTIEDDLTDEEIERRYRERHEVVSDQ